MVTVHLVFRRLVPVAYHRDLVGSCGRTLLPFPPYFEQGSQLPVLGNSPSHRLNYYRLLGLLLPCRLYASQ